jgi:hypothetical protein
VVHDFTCRDAAIVGEVARRGVSIMDSSIMHRSSQLLHGQSAGADCVSLEADRPLLVSEEIPPHCPFKKQSE